MFFQALDWLAGTGTSLALLVLLALLVPRVGRLINRYVQSRWESSQEHKKASLALVGAAVYIGQGIAYFLLILAFFKVMGMSLVGAAVPATVVSAALGFGAQSLIGDFLSGFFIITEKQYGVGDWVQFEGNGVSVEGDVIQITMRATRIRTLNGEEVTIPNGTARVCINYSNYWARAVAQIPVPLLGSDSVDTAIARSEAAALRALNHPDVKRDVMGELEVHPAVDIIQPTVVGMPWMISMRFIVQVNPARQWATERAIRTEVLKEFWSEYGSATTVDGTVVRELRDVASERPRTVGAAAQREDEEANEGVDTHSAPPATNPSDIAAAAAPTELIPETPSTTPETTPEDSPTIQHVFRNDEHRQKWKQLLSLGGRTRVSTTVIMVLALLLILAKGLTVEPEEDWRANTRFVNPTTSPSVPDEAESDSDPTPTTKPTEPRNSTDTGQPDSSSADNQGSAGTSGDSSTATGSGTGSGADPAGSNDTNGANDPQDSSRGTGAGTGHQGNASEGEGEHPGGDSPEGARAGTVQ